MDAPAVRFVFGDPDLERRVGYAGVEVMVGVPTENIPGVADAQNHAIHFSHRMGVSGRAHWTMLTAPAALGVARASKMGTDGDASAVAALRHPAHKTISESDK